MLWRFEAPIFPSHVGLGQRDCIFQRAIRVIFKQNTAQDFAAVVFDAIVRYGFSETTMAADAQ